MDVSGALNYLAWGNTEEVTLTSVTRAGDLTFSVPTAKRRALTYKELAASGGAYTSKNRVWLLPAAVVSAAGATGDHRPKPADAVTDADGDRWTVLQADLQHLRSTWRLTTICLAIAYLLRDVVSIRRADGTRDAAGGRVPCFTTVYAGLACRIQPDAAQVADERGQRLTARRYTVYLEREVAVTPDSDQVVDAAGNVYEITAYEGAGRLDELSRLSVERRGW